VGTVPNDGCEQAAEPAAAVELGLELVLAVDGLDDDESVLDDELDELDEPSALAGSLAVEEPLRLSVR
jgi:hypothetical protein